MNWGAAGTKEGCPPGKSLAQIDLKNRSGRKCILTTVRRRHYSYRTEQSYLVWLERFARHFKGEHLESLGGEEIRSFLDALALSDRLSASSQRQALNALVFLFREVLGKELGDFSDYRRAKARSRMPVWLTREELDRLFDQLESCARLAPRGPVYC